MPMDFPDLKSLKSCAEVHKFRQPKEGESENDFRTVLADHVKPIDHIESMEIRNKVGWDQWSQKQEEDCLIDRVGAGPISGLSFQVPQIGKEAQNGSN